MKIKMLNSMSSPERSAIAGDVIDVPEEIGKDFINGGYAVPFKGSEQSDVDVANALKLPDVQPMLDKLNAEVVKAPADFKREQELVKRGAR